MKRLTQERVRELFDYVDGNLIWKIDKRKIRKNDIVGYINSVGYLAANIGYEKYLVHRLIWFYFNGYFPENDIDHIDRNKLNNKIENLREVTRSCNLRNTGNRTNNISGVKGVSWKNNHKKWHARIMVKYKDKFLGYHNDFNEAVLARLAAEQCLDWQGCDSSSPAYAYAIRNKLIRSKP